MAKKLVFSIVILLLAGQAFGQHPEKYNVNKLVKLKAESACQLLASVTVQPKSYIGLASRTEAKIGGMIDPEKGYVVLVFFPYRQDGVGFGCAFRDYKSGGTIKLLEFGHMGAEEKITFVNALW